MKRRPIDDEELEELDEETNTFIRRAGGPVDSPKWRPSARHLVIAGFGIMFVTVAVLLLSTLAALENKGWDGVVESSSSDTRQYSYLELPNKLKVLVISDPDAEEAAASMSVGVGHFSDPDNIPGLAHFCEHMLFMGSEKYPVENEYGQFLSSHGGYSNAYTSSEETNYYFKVLPQHLPKALDIFSQFFVSPLFNRSSVEKEMHAVNNEHKKNINNDAWRINMLQRSLAATGHPMRKFGTGNLATLSIPNIDDELKKWYGEHYSANDMALVVYGKESAPELVSLVSSLFEGVKNRKLSKLVLPKPVVDPASVPAEVKFVPINDENTLILDFSLDLVPSESFDTKSHEYISHVLGHEAVGGVASYLKREKNWIESLSVGIGEEGSNFAFFEITMKLTEDGMENVDEIIGTVFAYLNLMRLNGAQRWIWEESKDLAAVNFKYLEKSDPTEYVQRLANKLQIFPPRFVVSSGYTYARFDLSLIDALMAKLVPENVIVFLGSKKYASETEGGEGKGEEMATEPTYGTRYTKEKISAERVAKWRGASSDKLVLIHPNEMIPENLDVFAGVKSDEINLHPTVVTEEAGIKIYFLADEHFLRPKAFVTAELVYAETPSENIASHLQNHLSCLLLSDEFESSVGYYAAIAGLSYSVSPSFSGVVVTVSGYNSKLATLAHLLVTHWTNLQVDPRRFEVVREALRKDLDNELLGQPFAAARRQMDKYLTKTQYTIAEMSRAIVSLTAESQHAWEKRQSCVGVLASVYGNVNREDAQKIINTITVGRGCQLKHTSLRGNQFAMVSKAHERGPAPVGFVATESLSNINDINSAVISYYQLGPTRTNIANDAKNLLFGEIMSNACFDTLRTKEQLGYIASCFAKKSNGQQGFGIVVQSSDYDPFHLHSRISAFLSDSHSVLNQADFETYKKSVEMSVRMKPQRMSEVGERVWFEIKSGYDDWAHTSVLADAVASVTKDEMLNFSSNLLVAGNLFSSWVFNAEGFKRAADKTPADYAEANLELLTDRIQFQSRVSLWLQDKPILL